MAGLSFPMPHPTPATVGQLKDTGYQPCSVKDELRRNVIRKLKTGEELFPGIVGYRETVLPQIVNGLLSRHDLLFLGLRGQAKTRILRMLPTLLDERIPVLADVEIRGYPIRLELDVALVFSANPEDYTNRGRIVTPLKDRIGSVVRTHYPESVDEGIAITEQNAWLERTTGPSASGVLVDTPRF